MIKHYYYNGQLKKAVIAFANIFTGMIVQTGKNGCGTIDDVEVPVRYGSGDRVAFAIGSGNTQNALPSLPIMSCYMTSIQLAPERMHGVNGVDRRTYLEQGGIYPNDIKAIRRVVPIPYNLEMELSIFASNTDQAYQIIEQILIMFDYDLQIQTSDSNFDWARQSKVTLTGINNEENYPMGTDKRILSWTLSFEYPIWISPPYEVRTEIINRINTNIGNMSGMLFNEYDETGNLVPFDPLVDGFGTIPIPTPQVP
jgi:hypothetical protein